MSDNSKIEWTDATWNPLAGCSMVSRGCHNCYAMRTAARLEAMGQEKYAGTTKKVNGKTLWTGKINLDNDALSIPLRTKKPTTYVVNSMSDLFHEDVPDEFIAAVFGVMAACPQHTFQVLTKRAERLTRWSSWIDDDAKSHGLTKLGRCLWREAAHNGSNCPRVTQDIFERLGCDEWPLPNVWLGVSCEDQRRADDRIPWLLKTPAAVRFLSCEPLLGPLDLWPLMKDVRICEHCRKPGRDGLACEHCGKTGFAFWPIDWVIVGGESGPGARPCRLEWVESIVEQCKAASVPCFVKQLGAKPINHYGEQLRYEDRKGGDIETWPSNLRVRQMPETVTA